VGAILDQRHHISDPARRDFDMVSLQSLIEQRAQFLDALRMFIGAVAAIALLVGGIGVANIMLVSITERTREIGVRKAVGASHGAILRQFLIESSLLAGVGGVVGVVVGIATCWAVGAVLPSLNANFPPPVVSAGSALLAFAISLLVGVVAGSYPASHAAHLRIVDALRFE
jgi:putative ABC transport system permease protein